MQEAPIDAIAAVLAVLRGRWNVFILNDLQQGTRRFGELKKAIPAITQKMLTQHLRELEEEGLVTRAVYPQVPPRVEYTLTAHGETLAPVLATLIEWGSLHRLHLESQEPVLEPENELELLDQPALVMPLRERPASSLSHEALTEAVRAAAM